MHDLMVGFNPGRSSVVIGGVPKAIRSSLTDVFGLGGHSLLVEGLRVVKACVLELFMVLRDPLVIKLTCSFLGLIS